MTLILSVYVLCTLKCEKKKGKIIGDHVITGKTLNINLDIFNTYLLPNVLYIDLILRVIFK